MRAGEVFEKCDAKDRGNFPFLYSCPVVRRPVLLHTSRSGSIRLLRRGPSYGSTERDERGRIESMRLPDPTSVVALSKRTRQGLFT